MTHACIHVSRHKKKKSNEHVISFIYKFYPQHAILSVCICLPRDNVC